MTELANEATPVDQPTQEEIARHYSAAMEQR